MMLIEILELDLENRVARAKASLPKRVRARSSHSDLSKSQVLEQVEKKIKEQSDKIVGCNCLTDFVSICNKYEYNMREVEIEISLVLREEKKPVLKEEEAPAKKILKPRAKKRVKH
jgi:hypothetical protein